MDPRIPPGFRRYDDVRENLSAQRQLARGTSAQYTAAINGAHSQSGVVVQAAAAHHPGAGAIARHRVFRVVTHVVRYHRPVISTKCVTKLHVPLCTKSNYGGGEEAYTEGLTDNEHDLVAREVVITPCPGMTSPRKFP